MAICHITTSDIRTYLSDYQEEHQSSKVTIDNMRRIFSSFFAWLEDEDYIAKSPVRRIHKVKTDSLVKEVLSDEQLEQLRGQIYGLIIYLIIVGGFVFGMRQMHPLNGVVKQSFALLLQDFPKENGLELSLVRMLIYRKDASFMVES